MGEKIPFTPFTDLDVDLEAESNPGPTTVCSHQRHTNLFRTFCAPCPGDIEAIKSRQPSPFRLAPELVTHPFLQDVDLDYSSKFLSEQLQSYAPRLATSSISDNNKQDPYTVAWAEIVMEQTRYEMYGRSNSRFNHILWLVILVWATTTLTMDYVWCYFVLHALRPLQIGGHETMVAFVYFGMLVPFICMLSWMHRNMREIALKKWAY